MDWSQGFSSSYYGYYVDPVSWRDIERFEIIDGSIEKSTEDLRESASITVSEYDQSIEKWIRIYLDTKQNESGAHVPLFTGIAATPDKNINGKKTEYTLDCYSVLKPADDILLKRGWYAPADTPAGDILKELLSGFAPVVIEDDSPYLTQAIIAEDGETNLSMADKILVAINWRLRIDGDGTINVLPKPIEVSATFDPQTNDVIEPEVTFTRDWFDCPNCFRAVADDVTAEYKDESPDSPLSVDNRGREVWAEEDGCELSETESLAEYAMRRLKEEQSVALNISYSRRFDPEVNTGDLVYLHYVSNGLDGVFKVCEQSIELGYGARVSERVTYETDYQ